MFKDRLSGIVGVAKEKAGAVVGEPGAGGLSDMAAQLKDQLKEKAPEAIDVAVNAKLQGGSASSAVYSWLESQKREARSQVIGEVQQAFLETYQEELAKRESQAAQFDVEQGNPSV